LSLTVSIFDVDRTLTRKPTYSAFLLYGALRTAPWRLALLPMLVPHAIAYAAKRISRKRMKEAMHGIALGNRLDRKRAIALAEDFASALAERGVYPEIFEMIDAERRSGRLIVLATAAPELYIEPLARMLGADVVLASKSSWKGDWLTPQIEGENCYGKEKLDKISAWLSSREVRREEAHIRFYSDHASDLPTLEWVDEPIMVNPSAKLLEIGRERGWRLLKLSK
jgi:HAD superfamily hydrolase (TIGR01490 family)